MRKEVYICDRCGANLENFPPYSLKLTALTVQEQVEWHYCHSCWKNIKDVLNGKIFKISSSCGGFTTTSTVTTATINSDKDSTPCKYYYSAI